MVHNPPLVPVCLTVDPIVPKEEGIVPKGEDTC